MPTRTAFVLTIGEVIEAGPTTVAPSSRRNASAPSSPSSNTGGGGITNMNYKRSVSNSSKLNGRVGASSRGRPLNGHYKQSAVNGRLLGGLNGNKKDRPCSSDHSSPEDDGEDGEGSLIEGVNNSDSESENSNDSSSDLVFTTNSGPNSKGKNRMARMKTRHVSTGSTASVVNGNSQPSPAASLSQATPKNVSGGGVVKPKKSIMKPSTKLSQDPEDEEVSFRYSCTGTAKCGTSPE